MQRESVKQGKSARHWIVWLAVLIAAPATLLAAWRFGNRKYYLSSLLLIVYAMLPFFVRFEHRKPQARELVTIAVMSAVAVASRAGFIMVPFFKPLTGIVMITGMALGPEAGFLTGAVSGFVSNFIFGQGPWTPWQMYAWGLVGYLAGVLADRGWLDRLPVLYAYGFLSALLYGLLLNGWYVIGFVQPFSWPAALVAFGAALPFDATHGVATVVFLAALYVPWRKKLERIKRKYALI